MDNTTQSYILNLHEASQQGRLVVFVGAGVSVNSGVPAWEELINALKEELPDNLKSVTDDLKIAQIYKDTRGTKDYLEKVRTVLKDGKVTFNHIHQAILQLNPVHIITTNYDDLLEQAILNEFKQYDVISQDKDLPYYRYPNKLVKMHGDFNSGNIVLSEEDYYNYSQNYPLIRAFVTSLFTTNVVLFVGFSFDDLNLKIILNDLKNILEKDMQRVYLLTANELLDHETRLYYEKKGINIVNIPNPEEYEKSFHIRFRPNEKKSLTDSKGLILFRQLQIIRQIETKTIGDIVSRIYQTIQSFQQELTTLGDGIKYLFPLSEQSYWNLSSDGIQMDSPYVKRIYKQLITTKGKKEFVGLHPKTERDFLKEQALLLHVNWIDGLMVLTKYDHEHSGEKLAKYKTVDDFYDLKFSAVEQLLKECRKEGLYYDKRDLILPYLLCRIGRFYDAYLIYKERLNVFWKKELYILYFISLYNLFHIKYQIQWETIYRSEIDSDKIVEELEAINLESTLVRLPIPDVVKRTLSDLCYNRIFTENAKEAEVLSEKLHRNRKMSERGGASLNSHVHALKVKFWRVFTFCIRNCIEYNNSYFGLQATVTVSGILNSHATKDTQVEGIIKSTRIEALSRMDVFLLISFIGTKELNELFSQYEIKEIRLSEDAIVYLSEIVDNFHESSNETSLFGEIKQKKLSFSVSHIGYIFSNLLLLISRCANSIPESTLDKLFGLIHYHKSSLNCPEQIDVIRAFTEKNQPSCKIAIELLHDCIEFGDSSLLQLIRVLSYQLAKSSYHYDGQIIFDYLTKNNGELGLSMYEILPENTQKQFLEYMFENCNNLLRYLYLIGISQTTPTNQDKLNRLFYDYNVHGDNKSDLDFFNLFRYMLKLRKSSKFEGLHAIIDSFGNKYSIYRFLMNPLKYDKIDEVEPGWVVLCQDDTIKELLNDGLIRHKIKDYIKNDPTGQLYYEKIYSLL